MNLRVSAKCPTRIDLAGGTLDMWPIHHMLPVKATINIAIDLFAEASITIAPEDKYKLHSYDQDISCEGSFAEITAQQRLPLLGLLIQAFWHPSLPALEITTTAKSPKGAGLGGSSSLAIATAAAIQQARASLDKTAQNQQSDLVRGVSNVESRLIKAPTGCQDYWAAVRGGMNIIRFPFHGEEITTTSLDLKLVEESLTLVYSGASRQSAINNWDIFKEFYDGNQKVVGILNQIGVAAEKCADAIARNSWREAMLASSEEWELRRTLWPNIETHETRQISEIAMGQGCLLSRVCGAGGGGVMAIFSPPDRKKALESELTKQNFEVLPCSPTASGLQTHVH